MGFRALTFLPVQADVSCQISVSIPVFNRLHFRSLGRKAVGWAVEQPSQLHLQLLSLREAGKLLARAGEEAVPEIRQAPCK